MKAPFLLKSATLKFHTPQSPLVSSSELSKFINRARTSKHAIQIHAQLVTRDCISDPLLFNSLLNLYAKCGDISKSLRLFSASNSKTHFDKTKNVFSYTSIITHLSHCNLPSKALHFFNEMRGKNIFPNHFTFSAVLPACGGVDGGKQLHSLALRDGFLSDVFVGSAMIDMYARNGEMGSARQVFEEMPERNLVSWNSMIVGFLQNSYYEEAVQFYNRLIVEDMTRPDEVSFSSVLSACANAYAIEIGRQVHGTIIKQGLQNRAYVNNSLMDMYCKCGIFNDAEKLFSAMEDKDVVTWNIMVMGFVQNGNFEEACNYFWFMRRQNVLPDETSFSTALHAAAGIAVLEHGALIHNQIIKTGFCGNKCVTSSLITMYSKCGSLVDAKWAFSENEVHNVVSWTAMISACQQHGSAIEVIELFENMLKSGTKPDYVTFVSVLSACGHTGQVDHGFSYFNLMIQRYNINPGPEHYACMVDLLSRSGRLSEAKKFVEAMPIKPDVSVWGALLGACRKYGNLDMGREVADRLFELEPDNPGNYVLLSNMYARRGRLEEADDIRKLMGFNRFKKEPGCSWLDVRNKTYVFKAHDRSHSRTDEIYEMVKKLKELVSQKGYVHEVEYSMNDVGEYKDRNLWYHSERLALAFGLLTLPEGAPIRIKKNLRTCDDCHVVMKFVSSIFKREIIVRDINRFHRFMDGLCSCGDYW